eukprot:COSAG05_NODE_579_length_8556_cov_44.773679_2_plen_97_part_00
MSVDMAWRNATCQADDNAYDGDDIRCGHACREELVNRRLDMRGCRVGVKVFEGDGLKAKAFLELHRRRGQPLLLALLYGQGPSACALDKVDDLERA